MNLSRNVSREYIRLALEQRGNSQEPVDSMNNSRVPDWLIKSSFSSAKFVTSDEAKDIISAHEDSGFKRRFIDYCFKHKETIKKIPFVGKKAVKIKKSRLENLKKQPVLDMTPYLGLHFREFIVLCYRIMLGREADPSGISAMTNMIRNGASNECIVYVIAVSPEFAGRYKVKNINRYKKRYNKYLRRSHIKNAPVLGRIVKMFTISSQISAMYNDLDYRNTVLENAVIGVDYKLSLLLKNQAENNMRFASEFTSLSKYMGKLEKAVFDNNDSIYQLKCISDDLQSDIIGLRSETREALQNNQNMISLIQQNMISFIQQNMISFSQQRHDEESAVLSAINDMVIGLHQKNDEEAKIMTNVSIKLDELPQFITAKSLQSRTSIASYSDGVVGVQCGDYFFGVPSEEWGLAYFLMTNGCFEYGSERLFRSLLKPNMVVLDLGANLGIYTLHALRAECEVHSFEPVPRVYGILEQNVKANGFADIGKAHLYNYAVSDKNGTVNFFYAKKMSGHSNMYDSEFESDEKITVQTVALDDMLKDIHHIDIIKIDVEGAEYQAFCGMKRIISENPKVKIFAEFAPVNIIRAGMKPREMLDFYSEFGFNKYLITENGELRTVSDEELINCFSENILLTKENIEL